MSLDNFDNRHITIKPLEELWPKFRLMANDGRLDMTSRALFESFDILINEAITYYNHKKLRRDTINKHADRLKRILLLFEEVNRD